MEKSSMSLGRAPVKGRPRAIRSANSTSGLPGSQQLPKEEQLLVRDHGGNPFWQSVVEELFIYLQFRGALPKPEKLLFPPPLHSSGAHPDMHVDGVLHVVMHEGAVVEGVLRREGLEHELLLVQEEAHLAPPALQPVYRLIDAARAATITFPCSGRYCNAGGHGSNLRVMLLTNSLIM
eukprot:4711839-Amphidinium_carterae.2